MNNKAGQILLHITGCIGFLSLPVLLSPDVSWNFHFVHLLPFQEDFITYALLLLFFYLNYFILIPILYFQRKFVYYLGCIFVSYAIIELIPPVIVPSHHKTRTQTNDRAETGASRGSSPDSGVAVISLVTDSGNMYSPPGNRPADTMAPPVANKNGMPGNERERPLRSNKIFSKNPTAFFNENEPPEQPPPPRGSNFLFRIR